MSDIESENQQSSDTEPKEQKECDDKVANVPEIVHSFLTRPSFLDRIANYISTLDNSR